MAVIRYELPIKLAGRFHLYIHHFARGTFPSTSKELHTHPFNRFFIPLNNPTGFGRIKKSRNDDYLEFIPGHAYFIPLNYNAGMLLDDYFEFISIQFALELYEGVDLFSHYGEVREVDDPVWQQRAIDAYTEKNPFYASAKLHSLAFDFAVFLMDSMSSEQWESVTRYSEFQQELNYLQENKNSLAKITMEDLAAIRGSSRENFTRKFTLATGISPKKFLSKMIIFHACRMLIDEECPIKEISSALGFANEYYFSRFFRKHTGVPPGQYRTTHKSET